MLLEALLGTFLFAVTAYVLITMSTQSFSNISDRELQRQAWEVMDQQMTMIETIGLDEWMNSQDMMGEVERDKVTYQYRIQVEDQEVLQVYLVTLRLEWEHQSQTRHIELSTLMQGSILLLEDLASL